jgi:hypothetical protein
MKSNMKKLAVFVMMAAIAIFIAAATASAGDHDRDAIGGGHKKNIVGEYGFSVSNNCISTPADNWASSASPLGKATDPTQVWANDAHGHGVVTFKHDGTGTSDAYAVQTPPSSTVPWGAMYFHIKSSFTYTVKHDGEITITADSNKYQQEVISLVTGPTGVLYTRDKFSLTGWVSADDKTITLANPAPEVMTLTVTFPGNPPPAPSINKLICHYSWVLNRLDE